MKKTTKIILALLLIAAAAGVIVYITVSYFAQRTAHEAALREAYGDTLEHFFLALESGETEEAHALCSDGVYGALGLSMLDPALYRQTLLAGLSLTEDGLTGNERASLDRFTEMQKALVLTEAGYDPEDLLLTKAEDGGERGILTVTTAGAGSFYTADYSAEISAVNESLAAYVNENGGALMDIYDESGDSTLRETLKEREVVALFDAMAGKTDAISTVSRAWVLTLEAETDEDGAVTGARIIAADEAAPE